MCTLLVTANPDHISHAFTTPRFVNRGNGNYSLWALDFVGEGDKVDHILPYQLDSWTPDDDVIGTRLYVLHMHSPTGDTYAPHPARKYITSPIGGHEVSGYLWHNGQVINTPIDVWDTQRILDNLLEGPIDWNENTSFNSFLNWDTLNELEGTYAGVLLINHTARGWKEGEDLHESYLMIFRNAMAPLIYKGDNVDVESSKDFHLTPDSYVSSVPLAGHENPSLWRTIPSNVVFALGYREGFYGTPLLYTENRYNPYGIY